MKRIKWWWRRWRYGHQVWLAYQDWWNHPGPDTYGRYKRARIHQEHLRIHGP